MIQIDRERCGWRAVFQWAHSTEPTVAIVSPTNEGGDCQYAVFMPSRHGPGCEVALLCNRIGRWEVDWTRKGSAGLANGYDTPQDAIRAVVRAMIEDPDWR